MTSLRHYQICHYVDLLFNICNRTNSVRILCTSLVKCDLFSHLIRNVHIGSKMCISRVKKYFVHANRFVGSKLYFFPNEYTRKILTLRDMGCFLQIPQQEVHWATFADALDSLHSQ